MISAKLAKSYADNANDIVKHLKCIEESIIAESRKGQYKAVYKFPFETEDYIVKRVQEILKFNGYYVSDWSLFKCELTCVVYKEFHIKWIK